MFGLDPGAPEPRTHLERPHVFGTDRLGRDVRWPLRASAQASLRGPREDTVFMVWIPAWCRQLACCMTFCVVLMVVWSFSKPSNASKESKHKPKLSGGRGRRAADRALRHEDRRQRLRGGRNVDLPMVEHAFWVVSRSFEVQNERFRSISRLLGWCKVPCAARLLRFLAPQVVCHFGAWAKTAAWSQRWVGEEVGRTFREPFEARNQSKTAF